MRTRASERFALAFIVALGFVGPPRDAVARTTSVETSCETISKTQVAALFDRWNRALLTGRADAVMAEYAADATLLPTVQNGPLTGPAIGKYFDHFLKQSPTAAIDTRVIQIRYRALYIH